MLQIGLGVYPTLVRDLDESHVQNMPQHVQSKRARKTVSLGYQINKVVDLLRFRANTDKGRLRPARFWFWLARFTQWSHGGATSHLIREFAAINDAMMRLSLARLAKPAEAVAFRGLQ